MRIAEISLTTPISRCWWDTGDTVAGIRDESAWITRDPGTTPEAPVPITNWSRRGVGAGRLVLALVDRFDQRAIRPLEYAWRIPASERRALHVARDEEQLWELGAAWMTHELAIPLFMVENDGGVPATIARVVELERVAFAEVLVLMGRLVVRRRFHRFLHDRSADAIARALTQLPGVQVGELAISVGP